MYKFSKTSQERLNTCHRDLQLILEVSLSVSKVDFGIAEGHRPVEKQMDYFKRGRKLIGGKWVVTDPGKVITKVDGTSIKGKHNELPSQAVDIYAFVDGKASWAEKDLCYLGGVITSVAALLLAGGRIKTKLRWGGNWDGDGTIITDQSFIDLPHFELM